MEDIHGEATRGYGVTEAIASRIRDAWDLEIHLSGLGVFVEAPSHPPCGVCKVLGRFNTMLGAQSFVWAWLTGPYGVVRACGSSKSTRAFGGSTWMFLSGISGPVSRPAHQKGSVVKVFTDAGHKEVYALPHGQPKSSIINQSVRHQRR